MSPDKLLCACAYHTVLYLHCRAQGPEALHMLVYGSAADIAASRQRYLRVSFFAEERAEQIV